MFSCPGDDCYRSFVSRDALDQHLINSNRHRWCFDCSSDFDSWDELNEHREFQHGYCPECNENIGSYRQLQEHDVLVHGYCSECDEFYQSYDALRDHFNSYDYPHFECPQDACTRRFWTPANLRAHLDSSAHVDARIRCPFCCDDDRLFVSQAALVGHIDAGGCEAITRRRFNELAYECDTRATVVDKGDHPDGGISSCCISRILQTARRTGDYRCSYQNCGSSFGTLGGLTAHLNSPYHDVHMYKCPGCLQYFQTFSGLHQHVSSVKCEVDLVRVMRQMQGIINRVKERYA